MPAGTTLATAAGLTVTVTILLASITAQSFRDNDDNRVASPPTYLIVAPRRVRPDLVVQISVSVFQLPYHHLTVHAAISRDRHALAYATSRFLSGTSRLLQLKMPENAEPGNYSLRIEGLSGPNSFVFRNETPLTFRVKRVSVFISTDKVFYKHRSSVHFRVVALKPNLLPVMSGSINIYVKDAYGRVVRKWIAQQLRHGFFEKKFATDHPARHGWWSITVEGWGYTYKPYRFRTHLYLKTKMDVNVTMPSYITDNDYALAGVVKAAHTTGVDVKGNATVILQIQPKGVTAKDKFLKITKTTPYFTKGWSFSFPLTEMRKRAPSLQGAKFRVSATVTDWYFIETKTAHAYSEMQNSKTHIRFLGGTVRVFKPRSPLDVYIAVYHEDGSRYTAMRYRQVAIQTSVRRRNGGMILIEETRRTIPEDSIVRYSFTPGPNDEMVTISAAHDGLTRDYKQMRAWRHYSRKNEYLKVTTSTSSPQVDTYIVFTVRCSAYVPEVHYMISSGGNIIVTDTLFMKHRQKTFSVALSRDMVGNAKVIVNCIVNGGEVLADSLSFFVNGIRNDGVDVRVTMGKDISGSTTEVIATGDPGAFVALSTTQYHLYQSGARSFFTKHDVEEELSTYDDYTANSYTQTWLHDESRREDVHFHASSNAIDANTTFSYAGLIAFTDADLRRFPAASECNETLGILPCFQGSCYYADQRCDGERQCEDGADELDCPSADDVPVHRPLAYKKLWRLERELDDHVFAWKTGYIKPHGDARMRFDVPIMPQLWVLGAFSLHPEKGLAFNEHPIQMDSTRSMYIVVELPKKAVRGEQLGMQVAIFNNGGEPVEALLTLRGSKQFDFVTVQESGQVSSYNPRTVGGRDIQTLVPLQPGDNRFIHFPILPRVLGKVSVKVSVATLGDSLDVTKSVVIRLEGITNEYNTPYLIDLVTKGSVIIPDLQLPVPERFIRPEQRKHLYVPGSATAEVSLVGDIVGPGFYLKRLRGMFSLGNIHTNAESYIFNFGNNLLWLKYLKSVNQLPRKTLEQALYNMNKDMQNVYKYVHKNYAVGYYTREVLACVWSTSLALEFLSMAVVPEWEQTLYVDIDVLNRLAFWLTSQQNVTSGAFRSTKFIPDIRLMSNLTGPDGLRLNISDTAHALIALVTSQKILTGASQARAERATGRAADYLVSKFYRLTDPFEICMVTYALHLANHQFRSEAFHAMMKLKRTDEFIYWSEKPIKQNPTRIINTVPYRLHRDSPPLYQSRAVEGTAYALMVYLRNGYQMEAIPIMKWLQTQRNYEAGFDGTQDTLRATQALIDLAQRDTNRHLYDMVVTLEATAAPAWKRTVHLKRGNFATRHVITVPKTYGSVRAKVQGSGLALLQMKTKVNVEHPEQIERPPERSFDLEVDNLLFWGRNGSHMEMNICIRWVRTDISPTSGAAVLEVDIPTGYHVKWAVLQDHRLDGAVRVMLSKFAYQKVTMGIEFLNNSRNCFFIPAERWYPVANMTIQNKIRVYSTYEPAMHNTTLYTTYNLFHLHICQVCGSFQCPYCPFYNGGSTLSCLPVAALTLLHFSYWLLACL